MSGMKKTAEIPFKKVLAEIEKERREEKKEIGKSPRLVA